MSEYLQKKTRKRRQSRKRSHLRVRNRVRGTAERPRLAVFKSARHIYAQVIDDVAGRTLAAASTLDEDVRKNVKGASGNVEAAKAVGAVVAERAMKDGIEQVVFDRGGFIFHGKVKAVADAAREQGLKF